jgi:hypothetical protein
MRHDARYETVMGSDVTRDGMFLELWDIGPPREFALWAFYSDTDGSFEFTRYRADVPDEVEAWFHLEAKRRLPPVPLVRGRILSSAPARRRISLTLGKEKVGGRFVVAVTARPPATSPWAVHAP